MEAKKLSKKEQQKKKRNRNRNRKITLKQFAWGQFLGFFSLLVGWGQ